MTKYLKNYCKTVKPRYYTQEPIYIITRDVGVFKVTCKGLKALGFTFKTEKQEKDYIIEEV